MRVPSSNAVFHDPVALAGRPPRRGHVLVARLDDVGDVLLAGPAVRAAAALLPDEDAVRAGILRAPEAEAPAAFRAFDFERISLRPEAVRQAEAAIEVPAGAPVGGILPAEMRA